MPQSQSLLWRLLRQSPSLLQPPSSSISALKNQQAGANPRQPRLLKISPNHPLQHLNLLDERPLSLPSMLLRSDAVVRQTPAQSWLLGKVEK
ncbi:hypothetical protein I315_02809 [Cryptococcus gattii Ru294]|nr:hypothetical protein I315_02809 [Cryptococcus gattii Ru294]